MAKLKVIQEEHKTEFGKRKVKAYVYFAEDKETLDDVVKKFSHVFEFQTSSASFKIDNYSLHLKKKYKDKDAIYCYDPVEVSKVDINKLSGEWFSYYSWRKDYVKRLSESNKK